MSQNHHEIAMRLGTGFAVIVEQYLGKVIDSVKSTDKPISFGATVTFRPEKGLVRGTLRTRAPKIPVKDMDAVEFTLQLDASEQLEFLFAGTPKELQAELAKNADSATPDDGYEPGDNAGTV